MTDDESLTKDRLKHETDLMQHARKVVLKYNDRNLDPS